MVQLHDGGRYRLRNGHCIVVNSCNRFPYVFEAVVPCGVLTSWTSNGLNCVCGTESNFDIIAEVTEEKENAMDFIIEVGKFYISELGNKWEVIAIHSNVAFIANDSGHGLIYVDKKTFIGSPHLKITGYWIEPLAIKWEMIALHYDYIRITCLGMVATCCTTGIECELYNYQADHIATGWCDHIGETHWRDGRVERSKE